jgi:putative ABC transport system permease protein
VLRLVGRAAVGVVGAGLVVGLLGAMALTRFVSSFLFGVQPWDLITFGTVAAVLAVTGAVAALAPALRAARVDPVIAFRND